VEINQKRERKEKEKKKQGRKKWCWARNDHATSKSCNIHEAPNVPESMDNEIVNGHFIPASVALCFKDTNPPDA
jgi:hypothetical protein